MSRRQEYRTRLTAAKDPLAFLRRDSGLPGPRANLELLAAAADTGDEPAFRRWIAAGAGTDPTDEYVLMCGIVGLGRLIADGSARLATELRAYATDRRWRVRESVALRSSGLAVRARSSSSASSSTWAEERAYLQRAAIAATCEPRLLKDPEAATGALELLDEVTASIPKAPDRGSHEFRTLRQALGYCWSVAVAANPEQGKPLFQRWTRSKDPDIQWIIAENLKQSGLARIFPSSARARL
jgi:hypothetical protein